MSATPSSSRATEAARRFNLLRVGALILRLMTSSFITAIVMGVLATGYEYAHVVPLIMEAEAFERRRRLSEGNATSEEVEEWAPADGMERGAYTFLSNVIVSFAFSLMLVAIAAIDDVHVSMRSGLQRGAAGWTIFVALPSAGLPPELPGMAGADLTSRQLWWLYAVFFGALGFLIALLASRLPEPRRAASAEKVVTFYQLRGESLRYWIIQLTAIVLACVVAAIPHMSGAPHPSLSHEPVNTTVTCGASHEECAKAGPGPELAATYAVWCLATAFLYWLCLGVSLCFTYNLLMCFEAPLLPELSIRPVGPKYEPTYDLADSRFSRDSAEESRSVMNGADAL
jgi:cobalt transporter subunit CbtA